MNELNLRGGVLIIGSLLWQDHGRRMDDNRRKHWRRDHLDMRDSIQVLAPFRYGRESKDGVYTMTFSDSAKRKPGTGIIVPFLSPTINFAAVKIEANALSTAEGMQGRFIKSDSEGNPWSVLGILPNPKNMKAKQRKNLIGWWSKQLQAEDDFDQFNATNFRLGKEKPCVLPSGQLNFPWPKGVTANDQKKLNEFDFVMATATMPTGDKYPTVSQMKKNVEADAERSYFRNNYEKGIRTFQDEGIWEKLNQSQSKIQVSKKK